ncbi:MAG: CCA tRNA nucleotidyltransferase [Bacteroidota bacterium]|nr:CCA tRNA nucleotidyltransferase [Candidatus Kapabacteria bacterium]MCS7302065.1 CCA tRNA nucleotidyltransferase [Candidatus Kapabacteria bacterium]MCX7936865.1 CCA tRNA nucleotidyltransferase [Chlorobiota bacterium]MDW8074584.1 CCA tRNA nucleotidyltransferase [Bacteroidota bacterium]MDW8270940.1 CCA tRNA nucleotidyltransferase [Bacteroidota bacterium]
MGITFDDPIVLKLQRLARRHGVQLYLVGGYVRDRLLGRMRTDIDCTIIGDALDFAQKVARHFRTKAVIYERFRTAMVPVGDYRIEFVGTRKEQYDPNSRKPIVSDGTLEDDIFRRDFTVNALAVPLVGPHAGEILDLTGGLHDLRRHILRTPRSPEITFDEDPLRMVRAARFAAQLQFRLADDAFEAIKRMAERIKIVSQERITDELLKILAAPKPSTGFVILHKTGLLRYIFPELDRLAGVELATEGERRYAHKDVFFHTMKVLDNVAAVSPNIWLRFASLVHDIAKPKTKKFIPGIGWTFYGHEEVGARWQEQIFRRLKLPLDHLPYVETLVRLHQRPMALVDEGVTDSALRRLAVQAGEWLDDLFILCRADITTQNKQRAEQYLANYDIVYRKIQEVRERDRLAAFQSPVRGDEIMALFNLPPSPAVGAIKHAIEQAILDGKIPNTYEDAKRYLLDNREEFERLAHQVNAQRKLPHLKAPAENMVPVSLPSQ